MAEQLTATAHGLWCGDGEAHALKPSHRFYVACIDPVLQSCSHPTSPLKCQQSPRPPSSTQRQSPPALCCCRQGISAQQPHHCSVEARHRQRFPVICSDAVDNGRLLPRFPQGFGAADAVGVGAFQLITPSQPLSNVADAPPLGSCPLHIRCPLLVTCANQSQLLNMHGLGVSFSSSTMQLSPRAMIGMVKTPSKN